MFLRGLLPFCRKYSVRSIQFNRAIRVDVGALNRLLNAKSVMVYARFIGIADDEREMFYDAPAYISGFDFS